MEYYLVLKRREILTHATTWMNLENIMLKLKKPKTEDHMLYDNIDMRCSKIENRSVVARG